MYSHSQKFSGEHCRRIQTEELREFIILELVRVLSQIRSLWNQKAFVWNMLRLKQRLCFTLGDYFPFDMSQIKKAICISPAFRN